MSFFGFTNAVSALDAFQTAENVVSNDIANVSTPGASRQAANLTPQTPVQAPTMFDGTNPGTLGTGVLVSSITRVHDAFYDSLYWGANASQNYYAAQQTQLTSLQSALGEPNNGINSAYTAFQTAVQNFAANPTTSAVGTTLIASAQALTRAINQAASAVSSAQTQAAQTATSTVSTINADAQKIASLNGQIAALTAAGSNPNTLLDERDALINSLSSLVSISSQAQANGSTLVTIGGRALVNGTVTYQLAAPVVTTNATGASQLVVGMVGDPNPANPAPVNVGSGQLGAALDLYNTNLAGYQTGLNSFASALASEANRLTQGSYTATGQAAGPLFVSNVVGQAVQASNITVAMTDPSQLPAATANTSAGSLTVRVNAANNTVDPSQALIGNTTLANAPTGQLNGTITVNVDGIAPPITLNYQVGGTVPAGTIDASSIDTFISGFNAQAVGITASFDTSTQTVVFARDPTNISLVHRAQMQAAGGATTPDFTLTDSLAGSGPSAPAALGSAATSLFGALGLTQINGVDQNASNAFGSGNTGGLSALQTLFTQSFGVPAQQTTSATAIVAAGNATITVPNAASFHVGDVLTIDAQPGGGPPQENVTVSAVNATTNQLSFTVKNAHAVGFAITSAQTQTLQASYAALVAQQGLDVQAATNAHTSQTALASSIQAQQQSVNGINIDDETQNLVKFQNAYAAAAQTVTALENLIKDSVNLFGGVFT